MQFSDFHVDEKWSPEFIENYKKYHREIWEDLEYFRYGVDINPGDIVVDCGASIGFFSLLALEKKAKKIISFECNQNIFTYLEKNCKKSKKIKPVNAFINHPSVNAVGDIVKNQYHLASIFKEFKLSHIDFLKLDVEGFEFAFILNETDENIKKVNNWAIEVHTCGLFCNQNEEYKYAIGIIDKLSTNGFECVMTKLHLNTCCYMVYAKKI
jgi:hypothetical protein